ncbi:MAG: RadC family protein [Clostridia bacterium]|nr:RadC family protein [Clostridia bacterium]
MAKEYPHAGHRKRLRERFLLGGAEALSETELLEMLLFYSVPRVDTKPLAQKLLQAFGSLDGVLAASPADLHAFASVSDGTDALFSLVRYLNERNAYQMGKARFSSPAFIESYLPMQFQGYTHERALLFYLDDSGSMIHRQCILSGTENAIRISWRSVAETAKRVGASALILAHNHPNGIALPSGADLVTTKNLYHTLKAQNILLLEHYIVAGEQCVPILQNNEHLKQGDALQEDAFVLG